MTEIPRRCRLDQLTASERGRVLQAVLDAIAGTLDPSTQIADHPNVKFAQMERLKLLAEGAQGWQPIATAPKNQRIVLYRPSEGWVATGEYDDDVHGYKPEPFWRDDHAGISWSRVNPPTHWMPLPPRPPETARGDQ